MAVDLFKIIPLALYWYRAAVVASPLVFGALPHIISAEPTTVREMIVGEAILDERAYQFLEEISDRYGPRMIGTEGHRLSLDHLERELKAQGLQVERQKFTFPGWVRGKPRVAISAPFARELRTVELGYVTPSEPVSGSIKYVDTKDVEAITEEALEGKVLLLKQNLSFRIEELQRFSEEGVLAALMINRVNGGQLLARVSNHQGLETPIPVLSVTQEEGLWIKRLVEEGRDVRVTVETGGQNHEMEGTNLIATLPGEREEVILLGGHFDSWDLGQGAIDNGLGVAQLYDAARILRKVAPDNEYTVKFVWFDAEEFGLWGSYHFVETEALENVRVMINLDMVGQPLALNAMGFDQLREPLEAFSGSLGSWSFQKPVANKTWLGSDHHPFILKGVPSVTFNAPLDHDDSRFYHDFGDTFDKVDREMLGRASAIITLLVHQLANDVSLELERLGEAEVVELFRKAGVEERMKRSGHWPFEEME